jgi:predicted RNase H-like HicB family nuclease
MEASMKYQIIIEKTNDNQYLAYCPTVDVSASGTDAHKALAALNQYMLCFLHDCDAQLEVMAQHFPRKMKHEKRKYNA